MDPSVAMKLYSQQNAPPKAATDAAFGEQVRDGAAVVFAHGCISLLLVDSMALRLMQMNSSEEFFMQFGLRVAQLIAPTAHVQAVQQAIRQTILEATALANGVSNISSQTSAQQRQLELVFVHDCR